MPNFFVIWFLFGECLCLCMYVFMCIWLCFWFCDEFQFERNKKKNLKATRPKLFNENNEKNRSTFIKLLLSILLMSVIFWPTKLLVTCAKFPVKLVRSFCEHRPCFSRKTISSAFVWHVIDAADGSPRSWSFASWRLRSRWSICASFYTITHCRYFSISMNWKRGIHAINGAIHSTNRRAIFHSATWSIFAVFLVDNSCLYFFIVFFSVSFGNQDKSHHARKAKTNKTKYLW